MKDIMWPTYVNTNSFHLTVTTADFQQHNPYPAGDGNSEQKECKGVALSSKRQGKCNPSMSPRSMRKDSVPIQRLLLISNIRN